MFWRVLVCLVCFILLVINFFRQRFIMSLRCIMFRHRFIIASSTAHQRLINFWSPLSRCLISMRLFFKFCVHCMCLQWILARVLRSEAARRFVFVLLLLAHRLHVTCIEIGNEAPSCNCSGAVYYTCSPEHLKASQTCYCVKVSCVGHTTSL